MTTMYRDQQMSKTLNHERGGARLDVDLERFAAQFRSQVSGVERGYVYYQTCKSCGSHEAVLCVNPVLWHQEEELPTDISPWLPSVRPAMKLAQSANLPLVAADLVWNGSVCPEVKLLRGNAWVMVSIPEFLFTLWCLHVNHAAVCGASLSDPVHRVGTASLHARLDSGTARINDTLRVMNGVVHTDTDLLLVTDTGKPLLIVEEHRPCSVKKFISFSKRLSAQAGGGLVIRVETDGNPDGALMAEVWDTSSGFPVQLIRPQDDVRGYAALSNFLRGCSVFAPYLSR